MTSAGAHRSAEPRVSFTSTPQLANRMLIPCRWPTSALYRRCPQYQAAHRQHTITDQAPQIHAQFSRASLEFLTRQHEKNNRRTNCRGQRVASERRAVLTRMQQARIPRSGYHRRQWNHAAADHLTKQAIYQYYRSKRSPTKHIACAGQRLDFVGDHQHVVLAVQRLHGQQVAVWGNNDAGLSGRGSSRAATVLSSIASVKTAVSPNKIPM